LVLPRSRQKPRNASRPGGISAERKADEPALDAYRAQLRAGAVEAPGVEPDAPQRPVEDLPNEALIGPEWVNLRRPATATPLPVYVQQRNCLLAASTAGQCQKRKWGTRSFAQLQTTNPMQLKQDHNGLIDQGSMFETYPKDSTGLR
jgi:hypothetical protein